MESRGNLKAIHIVLAAIISLLLVCAIILVVWGVSTNFNGRDNNENDVKEEYTKIVKIYRARMGKNLSKALPSQVVNVYKDGFAIKTNDGEIIIEELKVEGKKKMDATSFLNGVDKDSFLGKLFTKE